MTNSTIIASADEPLVSIERVFDAPRALVFKLITDPFHIVHFYGPHGATSTVSQMDVRPGGIWRQKTRLADGSEHAITSIYLEVVEPERIVYRDAPYDSLGGLDGLPPAELVTSLFFEDLDGRTRLTALVRATSADARERVVGFATAMSQGNERLAAYLTAL